MNGESDSEAGDDAALDLIIFDPDTSEGTMLSRWLNAARMKLGDSYQRGSVETTQLYLEQLRRRSSRQATRANQQEFDKDVEMSDKSRRILLT